MTNNPVEVLANTEILTANPTVPTLAVIDNFHIGETTHVCGYVVGKTFYVTNDPMTAVLSWARLVDPESHISVLMASNGDTLPMDNPYTKFLMN